MYNALKDTDDAYRADGLVWRTELSGAPKVRAGLHRLLAGLRCEVARMRWCAFACAHLLGRSLLKISQLTRRCHAWQLTHTCVVTRISSLKYTCWPTLDLTAQVGLRGVGFLFKDQMKQYDEEIVSAAAVAFPATAVRYD